MNALLELAERCEAATGPDKDLDALIGKAVGDGPIMICDTGNVLIYQSYTASLDAALTLAPEGWLLRQMIVAAPCADDRKWQVDLHGGREGEDRFVGHGRSRCLALCAAALRARAASTAPPSPEQSNG